MNMAMCFYNIWWFWENGVYCPRLISFFFFYEKTISSHFLKLLKKKRFALEPPRGKESTSSFPGEAVHIYIHIIVMQ